MEEALNDLYGKKFDCYRGKYLASSDCRTSEGCLIVENINPTFWIFRNEEPSITVYDKRVNQNYYGWLNSQASGRNLYSQNFIYKDGGLYSINQSGAWANNTYVEYVVCE